MQHAALGRGRPGRGRDEVGLAAKEGGDLHQFGDFGHRLGLADLMQVGADRNVELTLHLREHLQALVQARAAVALDRGTVGLVEAGLEHIGQTEFGAGVLQFTSYQQRQVEALQDVDPGDHRQGLAFADGDVPARKVDDGHGSSGLVSGWRTSGPRRRLTQGFKINTCAPVLLSL